MTSDSNRKPVSAASPSPAPQFIESVMRLRPKLAVFDCDGTLWAGDAGEGFFSWELEQGVLADEIVAWAKPRYANYRQGRVTEEIMCGEMVTMHRGLSQAEVQRLASRYFDQYFVSQIFPEMCRLVSELRKAGCEVWAVSSTNEWVIRAAMRHLEIPEEKVIAAAARIVDGRVTNSLLRVPSGEGKPRAIREVIGRLPDAAFGNSIWDAAMLGMVRHPFVINPTLELKKVADQRKWPVYVPEVPA